MKKILVIEDDPFIRDISTIKLTEHGYTVVAASDGATALQRLSETIFDVALLDLDLPDISGLDILKHIRSESGEKSIPVVVFSNKDDELLKNELVALGISGYFVKASTEFSELCSLIDSLSN